MNNPFCKKCKQLISFSRVSGFQYHPNCVPLVVAVDKPKRERPVCSCGRPKKDSSFEFCGKCWKAKKGAVKA